MDSRPLDNRLFATAGLFRCAAPLRRERIRRTSEQGEPMNPRRPMRWFGVLALVLALSGFVAAPAAAAPPNDEISGAIPLGFPDSYSANITGATEGADEGYCAFGPSVWFTFTGTGTDVGVNTNGSDFDTVLTVYAAVGDSLQVVACDDDGGDGHASWVGFFAEPGVTYYFLVQGWSSEGGTVGPGNLTIATSDALPPPYVPFTFELTLEPVGTVTKGTGVITLRGTATCSTDGWIDLWIGVSQRGGRAEVHSVSPGAGPPGMVDYCDATGPVAWSVQLPGDGKGFKPGKATVFLYGEGCDFLTCSEYVFGYAEIQLRY